jgi:two-component system, cell cycle response regulator
MNNNKRLTVMIVEDDPADARLVMLALAPFGARARLAPFRSLGEALTWLRAGNACDVALLDLSLPDSFGFETIRRVREAAPSVAVIVLTGLDDDEFAMRAMEAGTQDYLVKGGADGALIWRSIQYAVARMRLEEELRLAKQRFQAIIDLAQDAIIAYDDDRIISLFNPAAERMFGYDHSDIVGRPLSLLLPEIGEDSVSPLESAIAGGDNEKPALPEVKAVRRCGDVFPAEAALSRIEHPSGRLYTLVLRDISERKAAEDELRRLATTDPLTSVANRREFMEAAERELARVRRYGRPLALLMLDVDHFKSINDAYGHAAGDDVLVTLAAETRECLRECDVIGRLGGEEFAVILPETPLVEALEVAERLRRRLQGLSIRCGPHNINFTVSIGVGACAASDMSIEAPLTRADHALYTAKREGRNRVISQEAEIDNLLPDALGAPA